MLTLRTLHAARVGILSVVAAGSSISSLSQRRPCAIAAISVAFVSDRMGRGCCCDESAGRRISRRLVGGVLLQGMWSVFIPLSSARREAPLGVLPQEFRQTGSATSHPRPPGSPQSGFSFPGKGIFGPEKSGSGKPNRMSFPQRRTLMKSVRRGGLVGLEPLSLKIWLLVRVRPAARIITENNKRPTIWMGVRPG